MIIRKFVFTLMYCSLLFVCKAENGYELWLRYLPINDKTLIQKYRNNISGVLIISTSATIDIAKRELTTALNSLLRAQMVTTEKLDRNNLIVAGTPSANSLIKNAGLEPMLNQLDDEGFIIVNKIINTKKCIIITGNTDVAVLYGTFHFLRMIQTGQSLSSLQVVSAPHVKLRMLNHWDNLDRTVERGYAGSSIWNWHTLPGYIDPRYIDYARANASIGINGTVLTNVNANAVFLTPAYLQKVSALADVFRPYGIKVYLTARFSAPIEIGKLKTADPLDPQVQEWWKRKIQEIYEVHNHFLICSLCLS